jgi:hypothetical protein
MAAEGTGLHDESVSVVGAPISQQSGRGRSGQIVRGILYVLLSTFVAILGFLLFEGFSSLLIVGQEAFKASRGLAERTHTQYDAELGWVNIPNVTIPGLYGPGTYLRTNSRGFRNNIDFGTAIPQGKVRAICSGDSFTLGYGVSNDDTWCQGLAKIDARLETVNMGQGGYGIDQAYLWYQRDGTVLDHDIHLFAFIGQDLKRMEAGAFDGYPKPTLALEGGRLVTRGVPVPRIGAESRLTKGLYQMYDLRSVMLLRGLFFSRKGGLAKGSAEDPPTVAIAAEVLRRLQEINRNKSSTLVVVFLPTVENYQIVSAQVESLHQEALRSGILWVDLAPDFRTLPESEVEGLFIQPGQVPFAGANGHYNAAGNRFVAQRLYKHLTSIPAVEAKLEHANRERASR